MLREHRDYIERSNFGPARGGAFASFLKISKSWLERVRQRRELAALDPSVLRDSGLTAMDAEREAGKPFWRD